MLEVEDPPFERVVILCAVERPGRDIGSMDVFKWMGKLPDETQIQACIGDAATGVISVENLLVIGEFFKVWRDEVYLVDVEPGPEIAGEQWTPEIHEVIPDVISTIRRLAIDGVDDEMPMNYLYGDTMFSINEVVNK